MTEFERLKCLIDEAMRLQEEKCCRCSIGDIAQFLIDNGVIAPPCEIGDKIYYADRILGRAVEFKVFEIRVNAFFGMREILETVWAEHTDGNAQTHSFTFEQFGKTVFLTKAEAEAALMEA